MVQEVWKRMFRNRQYCFLRNVWHHWLFLSLEVVLENVPVFQDLLFTCDVLLSLRNWSETLVRYVSREREKRVKGISIRDYGDL